MHKIIFLRYSYAQNHLIEVFVCAQIFCGDDGLWYSAGNERAECWGPSALPTFSPSMSTSSPAVQNMSIPSQSPTIKTKGGEVI